MCYFSPKIKLKTFITFVIFFSLYYHVLQEMSITILKSFEDAHHPLLGPTLWGLSRCGMWLPKQSMTSKLFYIIHSVATLYVLSQYIELWFIWPNLSLALRNLSVTMLSTVCVVKAGTFIIWHDDWKEVIEYVSKLEKIQLSKEDSVTHAVIGDYTKYSRRLTCFYWSLVAATVVTVIVAPLVAFWSSEDYRKRIEDGLEPYPEIISSWVPFDKTGGTGYWITVLEDILICFYGGGVVASYDSNAVVLMSFFAGQLKLLSINCTRLFDDKNKTEKQKIDSIKECHCHHLLLLKYSKVLNNLLSPVMFLYVIICSLMICASAIQMTTDGTTTMQKIWIAEYLMALIVQLFLYCWHSNEVLVMSIKVDDGVYASAWWSQSVRVRRCMLLLGGQLREKNIIFTAGLFTKLNLPTFIAILKGSYSYYTLLSNKDD